MQILSAVNASSTYASPYNLLPFIPPLPPVPAPPPFTLVPNTFPSQTTSSTTSTTQSTGRLSPAIKRPIDENSNNNHHSDNDIKRARHEPIRSHNFDEENIAPVPSLLDANINTLKKRYIGVIQQLYIGKYQCRLCGLRFTAKQKHLYTQHLDWHYVENRQAATTAASSILEHCRDWYPSLQEWTEHEENLDEQIRNNQMMLTQNRHTKDLEKQLSLSSEIISCSAKGDGNTDDDVRLK